MRKFMLLFVALILSTTLVGCLESDADAYDQEGFKLVKEYVEEIILATDDLIINAEGWLESESAESYEQMITAANDVKNVNDKLFKFSGNEKYDKEEMESWTIDLSLEEGEWVIEGDELYKALSNMENNSNRLVTMILELQQSDHNEEQLSSTIDKTQESTDVIREMFKR